jgi:ethanolamine permease
MSLWFSGGMHEFIKVIPLHTWFYVGIESVAFACEDTINPVRNIPIGTISCMITLLITSIFIICLCCASEPGILVLSSDSSPLSYGLSRIFGCSSDVANTIILPILFATAFGFMFPVSRLLHSLAESNLIYNVFAVTNEDQVPYVNAVLSSLFGFAVCAVTYLNSLDTAVLFHICILCAYMTYCSQCVGYIYFRTKYISVERFFCSPFGVYGAIYSGLVFSIGILSVVFLQDDENLAALTFFLFLFSISIYYFIFVETVQVLSHEEERVLLILHVINYKAISEERRRTHRKEIRTTWSQEGMEDGVSSDINLFLEPTNSSLSSTKSRFEIYR